jgi:hypothetical protein
MLSTNSFTVAKPMFSDTMSKKKFSYNFCAYVLSHVMLLLKIKHFTKIWIIFKALSPLKKAFVSFGFLVSYFVSFCAFYMMAITLKELVQKDSFSK